jgi:hypothetical protein
MRQAGCQKAITELSLWNLQSLSHLRYPTDTRQLTSSQGEADGVSDGSMMLQALGGVNLPCGWYRVRGQLPSTRGREHTHTHTHTHTHILIKHRVLSFLGIMKDGKAHSDADCLSNTPSLHSLSTSFMMVSLWTLGTGKAWPL